MGHTKGRKDKTSVKRQHLCKLDQLTKEREKKSVKASQNNGRYVGCMYTVKKPKTVPICNEVEENMTTEANEKKKDKKGDQRTNSKWTIFEHPKKTTDDIHTHRFLQRSTERAPEWMHRQAMSQPNSTTTTLLRHVPKSIIQSS